MDVILAQIPVDMLTPLVQTLANQGAMGAILVWFLLRLESHLRWQREATDRQSKAVLLLIVSNSDGNPVLKQQANDIISEIDASNIRMQRPSNATAIA